MVKRILFIIPILLLIASLLVYINLPFKITRNAEIEFGNELASNIESYRKEHKKLPETDNWELLEKLGFIMNALGTDPTYQKISDKEFELIFLEGFDGPYLLYNSISHDWSIDFPKIGENTESINQLEENYPWSKKVTQKSTEAILLSLDNLEKPLIERNPNFPSNPNNFPFIILKSKEFIITGYSTLSEKKDVYKISFRPKSEQNVSGPSIIVEINIKTAKAIQVYMDADA